MAGPRLPIGLLFLPFLLAPIRSTLSSLLPLDYSGYKLFRVRLSAVRQEQRNLLDWLLQLESAGIRPSDQRMPLIDLWTGTVGGSSRRRGGQTRPRLNLLVAPEFAPKFAELMAGKRGVAKLELIREDIQRDIQWERRAMAKRKRTRRRRRRRNGRDVVIRRRGQEGPFDLFNFNSYPRIVKYLRRLAAANQDIVELLNLTRTYQGQDLLGIRIGRRDGRTRPLVFVDAGVHAREWIAPAVALYLIDKFSAALTRHQLKGDFSSWDSSLGALLSQFHFVFVPVVNPDGYEYSRTRDRLWRKTRSRNESLHRWCVGADANRNWSYRWAEMGASRSPCSNIFPGWAPFSEPETAAIRDYLGAEQDNLLLYISLHSYGQLFLSPWGYTSQKPANHGEQQRVAELAIRAIRAATGAEYAFGSIADLLYPASGTSIDYWQHKGVPYIYGIELRPEDMDLELHGFAIPPEQIEPTGRDMMAAVTSMLEHIRQREGGRKVGEQEEEKGSRDSDPGEQ